MELRAVRYDTSAGVATITLNRPERLNAWTGRMAAEYRWCMATADADSDVRVIVVTGAGRAFCAGGDMRASIAWPTPARTTQVVTRRRRSWCRGRESASTSSTS